jgi:hypothetical protein
MTAIMIKKTASGFEVSNGTISVSGPSRDQLLAILDSLEGKPAAVAEIAKKVEKAGKVVKKKAEAKKVSNSAKVLEFMASSKGSQTATSVSEGTGLTMKQCTDILWRLWKAKKLKSSEVGVYSK